MAFRDAVTRLGDAEIRWSLLTVPWAEAANRLGDDWHYVPRGPARHHIGVSFVEEDGQLFRADPPTRLERGPRHVPWSLNFLPRGGDRYESHAYCWHAWVEGLEGDDVATARIHNRLALEAADSHLRYLQGLVPALAAPLLLREACLLIHGCALVDPHTGEATLFVGASGDGKTTMVRRLQGWELLADDTVLLDLRGDRAMVSGTIIAGKEGLPRSGKPHPLTRVVPLDPGSDELSLRPIKTDEAFRIWMERIMWFIPEGPLVLRLSELVRDLALTLPAFRLSSNLGHDLEGVFCSEMIGVRP